jgi:hypothetical protein
VLAEIPYVPRMVVCCARAGLKPAPYMNLDPSTALGPVCCFAYDRSWQMLSKEAFLGDELKLSAPPMAASDKLLVFLTRRYIEANNYCRFDFIEFSVFDSPNHELGAAPPFRIMRSAPLAPPSPCRDME